MKRIFSIFIISLSLVFAVMDCTAASFKVYGYSTRKRGEIELVYFNNYFAQSDLMQSHFGELVDREGHLSHSLEIEYGFTNRWTVAAYLDFEQPKGEGIEFTQFRSVFFRYRFFEKGDRFINTAIYLEYYIPRIKYKNEEELEIKLILEKEIDRFKIVLNPTVEKAMSGPEVGEGLKFNYESGLYWNISPDVRAGVEFFGKMGELGEFGETRGDRHWVFPAFKIELPKHIEWDFGAGFGLTDDSDDLVVKNIVSIVF
jgi:hypothetical protein